MFKDFCYIFNVKDRIRFLVLILLLIFCSQLEIVTLGAVPLFVAAIVGNSTVLEMTDKLPWLNGLSNASTEQIALYGGIILLLLFAFRTAYFMFCAALQEHILRNRIIAVSSRMFRAYMTTSYMLASERSSGVIINYITRECDRLIYQFLDSVLNFIRNTIIIMSVLLLLVLNDPAVSLTSFFTLGIAGGLFMLFSSRHLKVLGDKAQIERQEVVKSITEGLGIRNAAALSGTREFFVSAYHHAFERQSHLQRIANVIQRCLWPAMELITVLVLLGTMCMLLINGRGMESAATTLSLLAVCLARLKGCITELMIYYSNIKYNSASLKGVADEIRALEEQALVEQEADMQISQMSLNKGISVKNVTFSYPGSQKAVLSNVSLEIHKGDSVGFIGATGSGKSTLAWLILGLFKPTDGTIEADGISIENITGAWRRSIGFVPQDVFLLDDSIQKNIALGIEPDKIDQEALQTAIKAAALEDFISTLPEGLNSKIGERGAFLSGGQRQRIGIARALYRKPSILVFDEATSSLDNDTEATIMNAIENLRGSHTIITVAHRLSTVKNCDAVYKIDNGQLTVDN